VQNLIPAAKNIGFRHITNGCYRLHPVEWHIGEAAGYLAAQAIQRKTLSTENPQRQKDARGFSGEDQQSWD